MFLLHPTLGRHEDAASSGAGVQASRLRLEAVEQGMAVRDDGTLFGVPRIVSAVYFGSRSGLIGPITLDMKCAGARSAGNPHATCDVAGAGNQFTVRLVRHSHRKRGATDRPDLRNHGASPRPSRGFVCLVLAGLKLTIQGDWSWWRVLLPLWVVLGHNALYIGVGFVWLFFADDGTVGEEEMAGQGDGPYAYQLAAMLCFAIFADTLLGRVEGTADTTWLGLRAGWWALIAASSVLSVVCQLLFWSTVVPESNFRNWRE